MQFANLGFYIELSLLVLLGIVGIFCFKLNAKLSVLEKLTLERESFIKQLQQDIHEAKIMRQEFMGVMRELESKERSSLVRNSVGNNRKYLQSPSINMHVDKGVNVSELAASAVALHKRRKEAGVN